LSGFTITNGDMSCAERGGGGILCDNSSPTISNCHIVGNSVSRNLGPGCYLNVSDHRVWRSTS
jgi:hypothetical protein